MSTRNIILACRRQSTLADELGKNWGANLDNWFSAFWGRINDDYEQADSVARARIEQAVQKFGPTIEALTDRCCGGYGDDHDCDTLRDLLRDLDASVVAAVTGESFEEREIPMEITRSLKFPYSLTLYSDVRVLTTLVEAARTWLSTAGVEQAAFEVKHGEEVIHREDYINQGNDHSTN
jgi:hypothetical protein